MTVVQPSSLSEAVIASFHVSDTSLLINKGITFFWKRVYNLSNLFIDIKLCWIFALNIYQC